MDYYLRALLATPSQSALQYVLWSYGLYGGVLAKTYSLVADRHRATTTVAVFLVLSDHQGSSETWSSCPLLL